MAEVLVVATPCPLIIAAPVAFMGGMWRSARLGIIVKSSAIPEQLAAVRTAAFDKTGTLTYGEPRVTDIHAEGIDADELLTLAAAVEQYSGHPLAAAIVDHARTAAHNVPTAQDVAEIPANGVRGTVQGRAVTVGSARFIRHETGRNSPTTSPVRSASTASAPRSCLRTRSTRSMAPNTGQ